MYVLYQAPNITQVLLNIVVQKVIRCWHTHSVKGQLPFMYVLSMTNNINTCLLVGYSITQQLSHALSAN